MHAIDSAVIAAAGCILLAGSPSVCQGQVSRSQQLRQLDAPTEAQRAPLPDVVVGRIYFTPAVATPKDRISIHVEVRNRGNAAAAIPQGRPAWIAATPQGGSAGPEPKGETIAPGLTSSRSISFVNAGALGPGAYRIPVTADPANVVRESNENNNQVVFTLVVFDPNWRSLLQDTIAYAHELQRHESLKTLAARIEASLRSCEAKMLAAEQLKDRKPVNGQAAQAAAQELEACRKNLEDMIVSRTPGPGGADQYRQENRLYTMVSNVMKTRHDTQKGSIQNIR